MIIFRKLFITFILALGLSSCATLSTPEPAQNKNTPWVQRMQMLSALQAWNIDATIGIRANDQAESASLNWQQNGQTYSWSFFGPLGTSAFKLNGQPGLVELQTPQGKTFQAQSPEILLAEQTGWRLPISNLYYWVRGLPAPHIPAKTQFDTYHHLITLEQQGWKIHYLRYMAVNKLDLPGKMLIDSGNVSVKIIINHW